MSELTRDDLRIKCECNGGTVQTDWGTDQCPRCSSTMARLLTPAEFEAVVDADPRWVRATELQAAVKVAWQYKMKVDAKLAEWERHGVRVTQNCDTCDGTGTTTDGESWGPDECLDCVDGKVPADGVAQVNIGSYQGVQAPAYVVPV